VRVVDHDGRVILLGHRHEVPQRRQVTVDAVEPLHDD
jgi:hypothetical protein